MKKYGIWDAVILMNDGEVERCVVTAISGKAARKHVEARYEGCEVLKMARVKWLTDFSYARLSDAVRSAYPEDGNAIMDILFDCGLFVDAD